MLTQLFGDLLTVMRLLAVWWRVVELLWSLAV